MDLSKQPILAILHTQISTTIPQTDIISTNKQLINAVSQSSYKCAETSERERERDCVRVKLQALVYDILRSEEGAGKRCSECACVCERARMGDWELGEGG